MTSNMDEWMIIIVAKISYIESYSIIGRELCCVKSYYTFVLRRELLHIFGHYIVCLVMKCNNPSSKNLSQKYIIFSIWIALDKYIRCKQLSIIVHRDSY